jgi:acyl-CoA synthetase (AMP-forming)/AMP-acid ligase II
MHGTGPIGSFPFLRMGLPQIVLERFAAEDVLDACERFGGTATFFVPGMLTRLAEASRGRPPTGLRRVLYGGAPIAVHEIRDAADRLGPVLTQLYGRFEGGWPLATLDVADHAAIVSGDDGRAGSCGRPIAEVEVRLRPVPGNAEGGELQVRSDMVVADYADPDGWCALGDLAVRDADGYVHLRGRLDGMINTGSYHVYPGEVEEGLTAVEGVREARVAGEPDPTWGQAVTAYVVADGDGGEVRARIAEELPRRLAKYKIPKAVHIVPATGRGESDAA